ncbi:hypothetical protein PF005_g22228 [Phytophthora fragariae]|uniref:Uncharacterized protein n=1 Tax=Phytophthora fragariae TaxID=53985 RepID=A0A6A3WND8_9STRA|nr:hypothetical protein PF005_g22228 [Phytophthora fragariae]
MEDISYIVKESETALALVSDDGSWEGDHDVLGAVAHEYPRRESLTPLRPATAVKFQQTVAARTVDGCHASRSVGMDVSGATSSTTRSTDRSVMFPSACTCFTRA